MAARWIALCMTLLQSHAVWSLLTRSPVSPALLKLSTRLQCSTKISATFGATLRKASASTKHRFFFPGHNGGRSRPEAMDQILGDDGMFRFDLPELEGLDNIHEPTGPLLEAQRLAAKLYNAYRTWFLVNGSTSGIITAMLSCLRIHRMTRASHTSKEQAQPTQPAKSIFLIGRDSHKSVFDALTLAHDCDAVVLPCVQDPTFQVSLGVTLDSIQQAIQQHDTQIAGLVLTRPSYQGLMLDTDTMKAIISLCHQHRIPVVVDEAHGSHIRFLESAEYQDALSCGADVVVQSAHKTLTSLSQTAFLHLNQDAFTYTTTPTTAPAASRTNTDTAVNAIDSTPTEAAADVIHSYYSMLTTTSPNAVLLASLDATRAQFAQHGAQMVQDSANRVNALRAKLRSQAHPFISLLEDSPEVRRRGLLVDPLRLSVRFDDTLQGRDSVHYDDLMCEEHGIYSELNIPQCITYAIPPSPAISASHTSTADAHDSVQCLEDALLALSARSSAEETVTHTPEGLDFTPASSTTELGYIHSTQGMFQTEAVHVSVEGSGVNEALVGRISAETITVYPPGIPLLARGEVITRAHTQALHSLQQVVSGGSIGEGESGVAGALPSGTCITGCKDANLHTILVYVH